MEIDGPNETIMGRLPVERRLRLSQRVNEVGGWRGLFDPYCEGWKRSDMDAKLEVLYEVLSVTKMPLSMVAAACEGFWEQTGRPDVARDIKTALAEMAEHQLKILHETEVERLVRKAKQGPL